MNIRELYELLRSDASLSLISKKVMHLLLNLNLSPMRLPQIYSRSIDKNDELSVSYSALLDDIKEYVDDASDINFDLSEEADDYQLRHVLFFCKKDDEYDIRLVIEWLAELLIGRNRPTIDDYVEKLIATESMEELGAKIDNNGLLDITPSRYRLKKHGLIIDNKILVYPHQFLRRYYSANFVDMLSMLSYCKEQGCSLKIRLDPIRGISDPKYYQNISEADYWHGQHFSESVLFSTEKQEKLTWHYTRSDNELPTLGSYSVRYTAFRTSMMDEGMRQFTVEEYSGIPTDNTVRGFPGFGEKACIQKFAHFVFDQKTGNFSHIDGAVRVFNRREYNNIFSTVASGTDPGAKIGRRYKLFLVEGVLGIDIVKDSLNEFFRYNPHISEHFTTASDGENRVND